ncbi:hypothetical protein EJ02DRAFT_464912 [Clathrospora elynae]|uniref:Uncharacterized protein n=1 Tax=Clathrospora elynae TaxID=706981 RepID=A0A6A5SUJ9_9PLEO|nr:hypothetical protein EJ02DRAFT_464912 [Clathrospora elynae]
MKAARCPTWANCDASFAAQDLVLNIDHRRPKAFYTCLLHNFIQHELIQQNLIQHIPMYSCFQQKPSIIFSRLEKMFRHRWANSRTQNRIMEGFGSVIVPLDVHPSVGACGPVYSIALSYPQIKFKEIINVYNDPGDAAFPNEEYLTALESLNSLSNMRTIDYAASTWYNRDFRPVLDDIADFSI